MDATTESSARVKSQAAHGPGQPSASEADSRAIHTPPAPAGPAGAPGGPAEGAARHHPPHAAPIRLLRSAVASFFPSSMPRMSRRNYAMELRAAFFLPFLLVVVDSTIVGVIVKNAYEGQVSPGLLNMAVAILSASTAAANIISFIWVRLSNGLDKIRFINALQVSMIALAVAIGFAPRSEAGLWAVVVAVVLGRVCWSGFITIRSTIWGMNYGPHVRARVTGKLATVQVTMVAILGLLLGEAMNRWENADRWFYPVGGALSLVGVWSWSKMRLRGHRSLLTAERARTGDDAPTFSPVGVWRVLKGDRLYARFMLAMFLLGLGNLMIIPITVIVVRDQFKMGYTGGIVINNSLPLVMMPFMIPLWARLLDRVHVVQFRAIHSWSFVAAAFLTAMAVQLHSEWLLYVSAALTGMGFGGGVLAWNLGHLDFAPKGKESQYMGVHATLNGVRGILGPFMAVGLYQWLETTWPGQNLGAISFWLCAVITLLGGIEFVRVARTLPKGGWRRAMPVETAPPAKAAGS